MTERRDTSLGDAINRIPVPSRDEGFMPDLLARLERVDAETAADAAGRAAGGSSPLRRLIARRKASFAAAAALAAALAVILSFAGVPGLHNTQAPPASAADRLVVAIDAGLAKVQTMQGVMVFDPPGGAWTGSKPEKALFAATSAGDRLVDVRYKPDWASALRQYRMQLAALRKTRAKYSPSAYKRALSDLESYRLAVSRSVFVDSAVNRASTVAFFSSDAATHRLAFVKYVDMGWYIGLHGIPGAAAADAGRVWALATQLRSLMADHPDIAVADMTYQGRPATKVAVQAADGGPAWEAIVDKEYGVTLAVRVVKEGSGDNVNIQAFHVERLRVNRPLSASTFAISPDYRSSVTARARASGAPKVKVLNMAEGAPAVHSYAPAELARAASGTELVPRTVPAGYRLVEVARSGDDHRNPVALIYRRGVSEFVVWSGARVANGDYPADSGATNARGIAMFDRSTWPNPLGAEFVVVHGGVLDGAPAALLLGVGSPAIAQIWTATRAISIDGDLSRAELLAIAGSMRPLKSGIWGPTSADVLSLLAIVVALMAASTTLVAWLVAARRRGLVERPQLGLLTWPLIGLVLVVCGAGLSWHALLHNGTGYASRGWSEPLGRWVIAAAVIAVVAAAWHQLAPNWSGPIRPKFLTGLVALAALAGAALALVWLPLTARFVVYPPITTDVTTESWLTRITSSQFSPSATTGLYISIVGALFLFVGLIMMRGPKAPTVDSGSIPVPAGSPGNPPE